MQMKSGSPLPIVPGNVDISQATNGKAGIAVDRLAARICRRSAHSTKTTPSSSPSGGTHHASPAAHLARTLCEQVPERMREAYDPEVGLKAVEVCDRHRCA